MGGGAVWAGDLGGRSLGRVSSGQEILQRFPPYDECPGGLKCFGHGFPPMLRDVHKKGGGVPGLAGDLVGRSLVPGCEKSPSG